METVTLKITGMACGGCAASVQQALQAVPGVLSAEVALESSQAVVVVDFAATAVDNLLAAVVAAGYRAELA